MAGDWIKVRDNLHEDPAVAQIATALGIDVYAAMGRLIRIWTWADQQSRDGHAHVSHLFLDQLVSTPGIGDAMLLAGWLEVPETGRIVFPKYDRHMSKNAKKRALATRRKQDQRARETVTPQSRKPSRMTVTREEKSSSNKHLPVTNSKATAQPPRTSTPVEEPPRSTPPPESIATDGFPAEGVAAFASKHGVKVRKPQPASFDEP